MKETRETVNNIIENVIVSSNGMPSRIGES